MGYESRIHIVGEGHHMDPAGEPQWVERIASYDLCKMGNGKFREVLGHARQRQAGERKYFLYQPMVENVYSASEEERWIEEKLVDDAYGDPLIRIELEEMLAAITQEFEQYPAAPYRRLRPLKMMLEGFREEQRQGSWGHRELFILHEGY